MLQARGGGLAFIHLNPRSIEDDASDSTLTPALLAYVNSDHEFVLFSPHGEQLDEHGIFHRENHVVPEETRKTFKNRLPFTLTFLMISYSNIKIYHYLYSRHILSMLLVLTFLLVESWQDRHYFYCYCLVLRNL